MRLDEPAHDPEKWNVAQPDEDPNWPENSEAAVAWPPLSIHVAWAKTLETEYPGVANMPENVQPTTDQLSQMTHALVIETEDTVLDWFAILFCAMIMDRIVQGSFRK